MTEQAVREAYAAQRDAMVFGDVTALDALLADEFTLTHMTGYRQPKAEWLTDIENDRMTYHSMEDVELIVTVYRDQAELKVRTVTEATIWGGHGTWNLELRIDYERRDDEWIAIESVASTW